MKLSLRKYWHAFLIGIGFILSPLSWWNDIFVNVPLAYLFAVPFSWIYEKLFLPFFVLGYIITNLLGLILMHHGIRNLFNKKKKQNLKKDIFITLIYVCIIVILTLLGVIKPPRSYFS